MSIRQIDPKFHVTGQLQTADMPGVAAAGYRAVVCMRPDGEGAAQPTAQDMQAAAEKAGLSFYYLPAKPGAVMPGDARALKQVLTAGEGPVLGYCASGNRCAQAFEMARNT